MSDDGEGKSIKIPSFLIGKRDGDKLKEAIHQITLKEIEAKKMDIMTMMTVLAMRNATNETSADNDTFGIGDRVDFYFNRGHQVIIQGIIGGKI